MRKNSNRKDDLYKQFNLGPDSNNSPTESENLEKQNTPEPSKIEEKKKPIAFYITENHRKNIKLAAAFEGTDQSDIVRKAIEEYSKSRGYWQD